MGLVVEDTGAAADVPADGGVAPFGHTLIVELFCDTTWPDAIGILSENPTDHLRLFSSPLSPREPAGAVAGGDRGSLLEPRGGMLIRDELEIVFVHDTVEGSRQACWTPSMNSGTSAAICRSRQRLHLGLEQGNLRQADGEGGHRSIDRTVFSSAI